MSEEEAPRVLAPAEVEALVVAGRFGQTEKALERLHGELPSLERTGQPTALLHALYGRGFLLRLVAAPTEDVVTACDMLERAAQEQRSAVWAATACAMRASAHVDAADIGAAMNDLSRVDLDQLIDDLDGTAGFCLLDVLAASYARLRLNDHLDEVRNLLESVIEGRSVVEQATHWARWSTELAGRGMEPIASGSVEPDYQLLNHAVAVAARLEDLTTGTVPNRLYRTASGVRALAAAYRGRPSEALRLLGQDAFGSPRDLPTLERQVVTLAAMHAHALLGSVATARSLDEATTQRVGALPDLVLEVTRTRERLWLETHAGGDVVPVLYRLTELLVRLGWQGMDLVADTARQALEHQALRTESRTDALTGVGNRRALDEELRRMLRFSPLPMALVLVDVDEFKWVNDRFTHIVGDEVLRRVAAALSQQLRVGDKILRYGGDEFVVLLPRTGDQEARYVAERMGKAIARLPWSELADGLRVGITTGCASLWSLSGRRPDGDAARLFRRADEALLEAKRERSQAPVPNAWPASAAIRSRKDRRAAAPADAGPERSRASFARATSTGPINTGPINTGPTSTGPINTGPTSTGPINTGPTNTGPTNTGPTSTGPTSTGPTSTGPQPEPSASEPAPGPWHDLPRGRHRHAATGNALDGRVAGEPADAGNPAAAFTMPDPGPPGPMMPDPGPPGQTMVPDPMRSHPTWPNSNRGHLPPAPPETSGPAAPRAPSPLPPPANGRILNPSSAAWRPKPLPADPLTSQSASDRMLAPPPEPGRTSGWSSRRADPATGSMPLDPAIPDHSPASQTAANRQEPSPARARRRPPVIDLGSADGTSRTPFG